VLQKLHQSLVCTLLKIYFAILFIFSIISKGKIKVVRALYSYTAQSHDELTFQEGDVLYVIDQIADKNWWKAKCGQSVGLIPSNYGKYKLISPLFKKNCFNSNIF